MDKDASFGITNHNLLLCEFERIVNISFEEMNTNNAKEIVPSNLLWTDTLRKKADVKRKETIEENKRRRERKRNILINNKRRNNS
ncbi:Hypothetical protein SRAE_X000095900 [Strongyloides ratti]|uniref:Uncharacterized protein n=1 Tax=Strongyloides ratti TaxID=34506 RepID=A0A090LPF1_STRRB|nr:Hypothetical protein SRAE_X000095900 [Strongyloides ratti]CEF71636.1 Hypothetical protein SRAE_X000095900 [Strongyloides ratti]